MHADGFGSRPTDQRLTARVSGRHAGTGQGLAALNADVVEVRSAAEGELDLMDYRGVEYSLVRSIAPSGWRWIFHYLDHEFSDINRTRHEAITAVERAIDKLVELKLRVHE